MRALIIGLRNLSKKKHPRIYNYFGIISGAIIVIWVLFIYLVIGYLWLKYKKILSRFPFENCLWEWVIVI